MGDLKSFHLVSPGMIVLMSQTKDPIWYYDILDIGKNVIPNSAT